MKTTEAAALLTIAAAFDNRKPDADAAQAWALALDGLRFEDCRTAVVAHYRASADWLMPNMVINAVKRMRRERISAFGALPDPPAELDGDPARTHAWTVDAIRRIGDGEITKAAQLDTYHDRIAGQVPEMRTLLRSPNDA